MTGALRIFKREYRGYLASVWIYGVLAAFLVLTGLTFFITADGTREATLRLWFPNLTFVLLVTLPVISSRTLAEERRNRHLLPPMLPQIRYCAGLNSAPSDQRP